MSLFNSRIFSKIADSHESLFQIIRHLSVGGAGVLINWMSFYCFRDILGYSTFISTAITHLFLFVVIFPLQKFFTFKNRDMPSGRRQAVFFLVVDCVYFSLDFLLAVLFVDIVGLQPAIGKICGLALLTPLSFYVQKVWIFSGKKGSVEDIVIKY